MERPPFFQRPKAVMLRIAILRLLEEKPMHGYELMKQIEQETGGMWVPSHSMLYNTLATLEEKGYINSKKDFKGEVERTVYSITKQGKKQLDMDIEQIAQMVSNIISHTPSRPFLSPPRMLKHLHPEKQKELLLQIRDRLQKGLEEVDKELTKLMASE